MTKPLQDAFAHLVNAAAGVLESRLGLVVLAVVLTGGSAGGLEYLLPHEPAECPPCPEAVPGPAAPVEVPVEPAETPADEAVVPGVGL